MGALRRAPIFIRRDSIAIAADTGRGRLQAAARSDQIHNQNVIRFQPMAAPYSIPRSGLPVSLAVLLLLCMSTTAHAGDPVIMPEGKGNVYIFGSSARASSYYNTAGRLKRFDTLQTDFTALIFSATLNYGLTESLELNAEAPVGYFTLTSAQRFPDRSIFSPVYFGAGATYQLSRGTINSSISSMIKIPPGFHHGIYDDPAHPSFLSDGYLQVLSTVNVGANLTNVWLKGSAGYNWRDEEPADEIVYNVEAGFSKVEGTGIFVGCNGVISTADATEPLQPFYAGASGSIAEQQRVDGGTGRFSTIDRENYFAINAGAFVAINDRITLTGRYVVRLFGTNSLALQGGYLGAGYNF